jgi:hypothetical protein
MSTFRVRGEVYLEKNKDPQSLKNFLEGFFLQLGF